MNDPKQTPDDTTAPQLVGTRPRFAVRRGGTFSPLVGTTQDEVAARLEREVCSGQQDEIDLYQYVGTYKVKRTAEVVNAFE